MPRTKRIDSGLLYLKDPDPGRSGTDVGTHTERTVSRRDDYQSSPRTFGSRTRGEKVGGETRTPRDQ